MTSSFSNGDDDDDFFSTYVFVHIFCHFHSSVCHITMIQQFDDGVEVMISTYNEAVMV